MVTLIELYISYYNLKKGNSARATPRTYLVSNGLAAMGFSLPAAIAAKTIFPQKPVLCTIGDGGFAMTFGELETVKRLRLAFPIIVFNNDLLGLVYTKQKMSYGERKIGVALDNPDFVMIAKAFGMNGIRITKEEELGEALEEAFKSDKTTILDVSVDPNETIRIAKLLGQTREMA